MMPLRRIAILLGASLLLAGCPARIAPLPAPMTLDQVVAKVNENNTKLPAFKARIKTVRGEIVTESGRRQNLDILGLFGYLIYAQPTHLRMDLSKATTSVMGLGSNDEVYWMWGIAPYIGKCWVGTYENWNPAAGDGVIPIHPRQLAQLLGVDVVNARGGDAWPMLRVSEPVDRANILQFVAPAGGRMTLLREVWVGRDDNRPRRVRLFDTNGQAVIESTLRDWQKVKNGDVLFPHDVEIRSVTFKAVKGGFVPAPASRLRLLFAAVTVDQTFSPANRRLYQFRCPGDLIRVPLDPAATTRAELAPNGDIH